MLLLEPVFEADMHTGRNLQSFMGCFGDFISRLVFAMAGMSPPAYPEIWQCVEMIVGVYGIGYWIAAYDPVRHWPIVLVGLLGKIFGPIGFIGAVYNGSFTPAAVWIIITNDIIWWAPFSVLLWSALRAGVSKAVPGDLPDDLSIQRV